MDELFQIIERAKKEWETTVDAITENVALFNSESLDIRRANWAMAKLFDTTPQLLVNTNVHYLLCGCFEERCALRDFLQSPQASTQEVKRDSSGQLWILSVYPIPNDTTPPSYSVIVVRDVTQERLWQQRLIQAEQTSSMVRTAARLAYQITPSVEYIRHRLYIISRNLPKLRNAFCDYRIALQINSVEQVSEVKTDWTTIEAKHNVEFLIQDVEESLRQSIRDLNKIYEVIDDLHNLSGSGSRVQYIDLNKLLENVLEMIHTDTMGQLHVDCRYEKEIPLVRCNQLRMQTALLNVLVNAIQATQYNGDLMIQTQKKEEGVEITIKNTRPAGEDARFPAPPVSDWFNNIDTNALEAGLHSAYWIIQEHGGKVWVEDQTENAFQARIVLPIHGLVDIGCN